MTHHVVFSIQGEISPSGPDRRRVAKAVRAALAESASLVPGAVSHAREVEVLFTDDEGIRALNARYRGKDEPTDVLSFPLEDAGASPGSGAPPPQAGPIDPSLGSIVINLSRCQAQAEEYGHAFARELCYLTVHSVLHLLGYDHQTEADKAKMREHEERVMQKLGLPLSWGRRGVFGFWEASRGIAVSLRQRNVRVHIAAAASVGVLGIYLRIGRVSWALLALSFGLVIGLELCNTAIEALCDRVDTAPDERIRRCKDIAAGAVFIAALASIGVAIAVFAQPELWQGLDLGRTLMIGLGVAAADAVFIFAGGSK
jgi:probable rRNA maturation factor